MTDLQTIKKLVELQVLFNRNSEILKLFEDQQIKVNKLVSDNDSLISTANDVEMNINEMEKKVKDECDKREDINKRITSLDEGKDKIKIARQLKSWEKEMERMQQELSLIQAQIDYDSSKIAEMRNELTRINNRIDENKVKIDDLQQQIDNIKNENKDELDDIEEKSNALLMQFEITFRDYFYRMLEKTKGTAIVEVEEDACAGCNIVLPTQLQGDLGSEMTPDLIHMYQCPHCFRFLFYQEWLVLED